MRRGYVILIEDVELLGQVPGYPTVGQMQGALSRNNAVCGVAVVDHSVYALV